MLRVEIELCERISGSDVSLAILPFLFEFVFEPFARPACGSEGIAVVGILRPLARNGLFAML